MPAPLVAAATSSPTGRRVIIGGVGVLATLLIITAMTISTMVAASDQSVNDPAFAPSTEALAGIPANYLTMYQEAAATCLPVAQPCARIDWAILAAIGEIETHHGANTNTSSAGARGPMQFMPATWAAYGVDGDGDGRRTITNPRDAIPAAARYLRASGAPEDYHRALLAYNPAEWYVAKVMAQAVVYRGALTGVQGLGTLGLGMAVNQRAGADVLAVTRRPNSRITVYTGGLNDLSAGRVDSRIATLLLAAARHHRSIIVTSLITGHSTYTTTGGVSAHASGRAMDIGSVDGERCNSRAHGRTGSCWQLAREIAAVTGPLQPSQVIYGLDPDGSGPIGIACLSDGCGGDHSDHVHVGVNG